MTKDTQKVDIIYSRYIFILHSNKQNKEKTFKTKINNNVILSFWTITK